MKLDIRIDGMTCSGCERTVTKALLSVPGVKSALVSKDSKSAEIDADSSVMKGTLSAAVQKAGYRVL